MLEPHGPAQFLLGMQLLQNAKGTWAYNMHRSCKSLVRDPIPAVQEISEVIHHGVNYLRAVCKRQELLRMGNL